MVAEKVKKLPARDIVSLCIERNVPFYAYRLPGEISVTIGIQTSDRQYSSDYVEKEQCTGFVFFPFVKSEQLPGRFVKADILLSEEKQDVFLIEMLREKLPFYPLIPTDVKYHDDAETKEHYLHTVGSLVSRMQAGEFEKVVYARQLIQPGCKRNEIPGIFKALLEKYKDAFVSLVYFPNEEIWLGASPESLLHNVSGNGFKTMALAGTKSANSDVWGEKEREEQDIVRRFIEGIFTDRKIPVRQSETYTHPAGNVFHLCTLFWSDSELTSHQIGDVVQALHPTPAVCGLPKEKAMQVIRQSEPFDRRYYAGYLGPVAPGSMHLFVNLRCIRMNTQNTVVYVGGGITASSIPSDEWDETCLKAQMLLQIIENGTK